MKSIVEVIKGQARHVMRCLGRGHRETVYHAALVTALNHHQVLHRSEVPCPIWFMGQCIGMGRADLVVEDMIIEIKANKLPPEETSAQLQKYLQSLSKAEHREFRGVVINFNQKSGCVDVLEECMVQRRPALVTRVDTLPAPSARQVQSRFFAGRRTPAQREEEPPAKRRRVCKRCPCHEGDA